MHSYRRPAPAGLDLQAKLNSHKYSGSFIKHVSAKDLTLRYVQDHGFSGPLVVSDKTGLGLRVPNHVISATDIAKYAKESCPAVILGAERFHSVTTTIGDWSSRYSKAAFEGPDNLQALPPAVRIEFSNTPMARHVDAPRLVRQVDWVDRAWPKDLKPPSSSATDSTYPKVQKYCLIAMRSCYEGFSTGVGGSSTWFHVLRGKIVLWLLPPVERNLDIYEKWVAAGRPENCFLGDAVEECQRFTLDHGKTLFLPAGWIFAMYLADDTLAFHGSFIHSFAVSMQHRLWDLENRNWVSLSTYPFFETLHWYVLERYVQILTGRSFLAKNAHENENSQSKTSSAQSSRGTGQLSECYVVEHEKKGLHDLVTWLSVRQLSNNVPAAITNPKGLLLAGEELVTRLNKEDMRDTRGTGSSCDRKAFMLRWPEDDEDEETIQYFRPRHSQDIVSPTHSLGGARDCSSSKSLTSSGSSGSPLRLLADSATKTQQPGFRGGGDAAAAAAVTARFIPSHGGSRTGEGVSLLGTFDSFRLGDSCCDGSGSCNNTALRKNGCGKCEPCTRDNCGECIYCKDMPKFGGNGRMKQACLKRRCVVLAQSKMENGYKDAFALKGNTVDALAVITSSDSKIASASRGVATKVSDSSIQATKGSVKLCPKGGTTVPSTVSTVPLLNTEPSSMNSKRSCRQLSVVGHHEHCACCLTDGEISTEQRSNDKAVSTSNNGQSHCSTGREGKHCSGPGKPVSTSNGDQCSTSKESKQCSGPGKLKSTFPERPGSSSAGKPCTTADADRRNLVKTVDASKHEREATTRRQKSDDSEKKQKKIEVGATLLSTINGSSVTRPLPQTSSLEKSFGLQSGLASVLAKPQNKPEVENKCDFLSTITLRVVSSDQAASKKVPGAVHPSASTSLLLADPHRTCITGGDISAKQHKLDNAQLLRLEALVPATPSKNVAVPTETSSAALKRKTAVERCHECNGCKRSNCGRCTYCRDMKKNGGPGKMRKACVQRRCTQNPAAALTGGSSATDHSLQSAVPPRTPDQKTLPLSSLLQSTASQHIVSSTSFVPAPAPAKQPRPEAPSPVTSAAIAASSGAGVVSSGTMSASTRTRTNSNTTDAAATANKLSVSEVPTPSAQSVRSHVGWRLKSQDRCLRCEGCRSKNCGKCVRCRDMKQFGGPGRLKKACLSRTCTGVSNQEGRTASPPAGGQVLTSGGRSTVATSITTSAAAFATTLTSTSSTTTNAAFATATAAPTTVTTLASTATTIGATTTTKAIASTSLPSVPAATVQQQKTATPDVHAPKCKPVAHTQMSSPTQRHSIGHAAVPSLRLAIASEQVFVTELKDDTNAITSRGAATANDAHTNASASCKDKQQVQRTEVLGRSVRKRQAPDSAVTSSANPKRPRREPLSQPKLRTRSRTAGSSKSVEHEPVDGLLGLASVHSSQKERHGTTKRRTAESGLAAANVPATVAPVLTSGKSLSVLRLASRSQGDGAKDTGIFIPSSEEALYRKEAEKRQAPEPANAETPDPATTAATVSALPVETASTQQQQQHPKQQLYSISVAATAVASGRAATCLPPSPRKRLHSDSAAAAKSDRDSSSSSSSPVDRNASLAMSPAKRQRLDRVGRGVSCRMQCCADLVPSSSRSSSSAFASVASAHSRGRLSTEPAADMQEEHHGRSRSKQHRSPDKQSNHQPTKQKDLLARADSNGHAGQPLTGNCGKCTACRDMRCFGGSGKLKKACSSRKTLLSVSSTIASAATAAATLKVEGLAGMVTRNNAAPTIKRPTAVSNHVNSAVTRLGANGGIVESSTITEARASAFTVKRKTIRK